MTDLQVQAAPPVQLKPRARQRRDQVVVAGQWQLMWWKFRKHRLAMAGGVVTLLIYFVAVFAGFIAPYSPDAYSASYTYAPPQTLHLFQETPNGWSFAPYVNGYTVEVDLNAGRRNFVIDPEVRYSVGFLIEGEPYLLLGFIESRTHLIGPVNEGDPVFLLGADRLGRDMLSRTIYGTQISMTIGLIGVFFSLTFGIFLGGISGYFGGWVDNLMQRLIEFLQSLPSIPLWIGLAAAIPPNIAPEQVYFFITIILSLLGWTGLARVVRGRFLALKTEEFVKAARLDGCSPLRVIFRHMLPSFLSHIIAVVTLAIPGMILAETALSFLGIGLRPPTVSWGVLLQEAQNIRSISTAPWLLIPGLAVIIAVLSLNFLGDGLRDAADPYS
jgi:peptide/nickel transport system permease protein